MKSEEQSRRDDSAEKPADEKPKPRVIWEMVDKDIGRIRIVANVDQLTPEKCLGTDAMGVEAWVLIQWDRWVSPIAREYLNLIAAGKVKTDADGGLKADGY